METNNKIKGTWHCLPTEQPSKIYANNKGELWLSDIEYKEDVNDTNRNKHLYLTSEQEIKEGDWFIREHVGIKKCLQIVGNILHSETGTNPNESCKKVIATTDKSLNLPSISQSDIEKYVKEQGKWKECWVEMETLMDSKITNYGSDLSQPYLKLKTNQDGSICISPEEKNITEEMIRNFIRTNQLTSMWEKYLKENL